MNFLKEKLGAVIYLIIGIMIGIVCTIVFFIVFNKKEKTVNIDETIVKETIDVLEQIESETVETKEYVVEDYYNEFSKNVSVLKVGDTFVFGTYEQDNDVINGKENIEWQILYKSNKNSILLISKYILDCMPYCLNKEKITWEESDIRKFLAEDFYDEAFSDFDKHFIMENTMSNTDNVNYKTDAGNDTVDKVFLLSENQIKRYLKKNSKEDITQSRMTYATSYAKNKGLYVETSEEKVYKGFSPYWLRTPGVDQSRAEVVDANGEIFTYGEVISSVETGVRPCIWIKY